MSPVLSRVKCSHWVPPAVCAFESIFLLTLLNQLGIVVHEFAQPFLAVESAAQS